MGNNKSEGGNMTTESDWIAYVNGEYVKQSEAKISIFDHVVLYGDGVFDTWTSKNGYIFHFERHTDRLFRSAHAFMIDVPVSKEELKKIIIKVCEMNGAPDQYIKVLVTRGVGARPLLSPAGCKPGLIVFTRPPLSSVDPGREDKEVRAMIVSVRRTPPQCLDPKIKNLNYANNVMAKIQAMQAGMDEAIFLDIEGYVNEATAYSIFIAREGVLYTPTADSILESVTRETVFEMAKQEGIRVVERRLTPSDLYTAEELFFAATAGGIVPISSVDGRKIANGKPGPISRKLSQIYGDMMAKGIHGTPYKVKK